jgi:diaminohydroxyphosphoribosylaminopyrimidine deaminase/5-amino-6-(5-phosphoribosylamino)uracil reductase
MTDAADRRWMEQALALGALGEGATSPNPRVGCVLVLGDRLVGSGFHRAPGSPHAEALAVARAGDRARGATAYVNLEPCAHEGRTPPCADLLAARGVGRVVAALRDPNPLVDGRGFETLRAAGVRVDVGLLADASYRLNEPFLQFHARGRPLVTIKAAVSMDGLIAASEGHSSWITGEPARRFAHRLRLRHDAVLVGAGTLRRDDPRMTVRLTSVRADRVRVVLAPTLDVDPGAALFGPVPAGAPLPRVYAAESASTRRARRFEGRAVVVRVGEREGSLRLDEVLADLAELEVQSVLVEGGGRTIGAFLRAGLADRGAFFVAPRLLGAEGATPLVDLPSVSEPAHGWRLEQTRQLALGPDLLLLGRLRAPERGDGCSRDS